MQFYSILFPSAAQEARAKHCPWLTFCTRPAGDTMLITRGNKTFPVRRNTLTDGPKTPAFFVDVGLDSILREMLKEQNDALFEVYYALATDAATVLYRQAVLRSLEDADTGGLLLAFCHAVEGAVRTITDGQTVHHAAQADKYTVDGAVAYCDAVKALLAGAAALEIPSEGLRAFVQAVRDYANTPAYRQAETALRQAKAEAEAISFTLKIRKGKVIVGQDTRDEDFVRETRGDCIHAEEDAAQEKPHNPIRLFGELAFGPLGILMADALGEQNPEAFARLHKAAQRAGDIPALFIRTFLQDIRFYTGYLELMQTLRADGLPVAYPTLSADETVRVQGVYDMELALRQSTVVPSACVLSAAERGAIITGANHSGKTTYLRAVGQAAALTALGLPVPGTQAELPLFAGFFSHFSDAEEGDAQQGRLKEELVKLKPILANAGVGSLVLLNEMFSSTTAQDAQTMAGQILDELASRGGRVLCVTHTVGAIPGGFVSMVAQVAPGSYERLYTVVRAPAETHAHVDAMIEKYRLTYAAIKERIGYGV